MKIIKGTLLLFGIVLLSSCASSYKEVTPSSIPYQSSNESNGVTVEYKYNVLKNKKYIKKQFKNNCMLVAVKITNNTNEQLTFGEDIELVNSKHTKLNILENNIVYTKLKQNPASYLWYLLLSPLQFNVDTPTSSSSTPIGLILGPGIAGGNMIASSSANSRFKNELEYYNLSNKTINPGQTITGLIGINSDSYEQINVKVNKKSIQEKEDIVSEKTNAVIISQ